MFSVASFQRHTALAACSGFTVHTYKDRIEATALPVVGPLYRKGRTEEAELLVLGPLGRRCCVQGTHNSVVEQAPHLCFLTMYVNTAKMGWI